MKELIGKVAQLIYIDSKKNVSIRNVKILVAGEARFMAYCYQVQEVRSFRKSGIVDMEVLRSARRHHSQDLSDIVQQMAVCRI